MTAARRSERRDIAEALRELPPRHPAPARSAPDDAAEWDRIDVDFYEVRCGAATIGFVDVVGAVFVAYAGARRDTAVEVAQTLVFETAIEVLRSRS